MKLLSISDVEAVGHLHSLWHFVLRNAWRDADLEPWGDDGIESAARWKGEQGSFVKALREIGYLKKSVVHGWMDRAGELVKDRFRNERRRKDRIERDVTGDLPGENRESTTTTVPYRTLPYQRITTASASPVDQLIEKIEQRSPEQYDQYRLPKGFGKYAGVYVINIPPDECQFIIDKMRPGKQILRALEWRIKIKQQETNGKASR